VPQCGATIAQAKSVPGYVYRGLPDQFPCRKCGTTINLSSEERSTRDLANKVSAEVRIMTGIVGTVLSLVALLVVWLAGFQGPNLLIAFLASVFVAFLIANKFARSSSDFALLNVQARR
jgi:hypothetical protein